MPAARPPAIAVVVPILNEAPGAGALAQHLEELARSARQPPELVLVDGGSDDDGPSRLRVRLPGAQLVVAERGRARQMNAGARATSAPILLFLHADTLLPPHAL